MVAYSSLLGAIGGITFLATTVVTMALPDADDSANYPKTLEKRKWLSDINMQDACTQQWGAGFSGIAVGSSCNSWVCVNGAVQHGVNVDLYCTNRWGSDAYALCTDGAYSWACHDRT